MSAAHEATDEGSVADDPQKTPTKNGNPAHSAADDSDGSEDQEEDEPRLKYTKLTSSLSNVYRNGDDTSAFLVAGDKMVMGTHNGNIHTLGIPSLNVLRTYHAHSASVNALSISPIPPAPTPGALGASISRMGAESTGSTTAQVKPGATSSPGGPKRQAVPNTPSNQIYIASASMDGHVCVSSLIDPKDVMLRNFARPVQAVALSPEYKYDRTFLSGGLAGSLILTVGGKTGTSSDANTNSAAAAAQGWLGSMGLGTSSGKDTVLHSGEGGIASIKFSRTGRFVAWINEHGIKIMRSHMKLESPDLQFAWKRIAHIDRPDGELWENMAAVWKGRMEWVSDKNLESDDEPLQVTNGSIATPGKGSATKRRPEKLVVGWGNTAWILHVHVGGAGVGKHVGERSAGSASIVHKLSFDDCIISGLSLYTPTLLAVLAYRTRDDDDKPIAINNQGTPRRHRQSALSPELRLVEVASGEEVDVDTLSISRYESLSATDYHLGTLYIPAPVITTAAQRGALESLGAGFWDVSTSATRLFSSAASIHSTAASGETGQPSLRSPPSSIANAKDPAISGMVREGPKSIGAPGLKIFLQTPYDCVLAVKRDLADHLSWLMEHQRYGVAWDLLNEHPEIVRGPQDRPGESTPSTPSKTGGSLADFFADDSASQTTVSVGKMQNSAVAKEKRRIGDLWLQQLVKANDWSKAGQVAGKVLGTSTRWEHWVLAFAQADRFDEITPFIPSTDLRPSLPSFVYEVVLGHYISHDPTRFAELLDKWDPELFDATSVISAIHSRLELDEISQDGPSSSEWRILMSGLAKLQLANGHAREALRCYIQLQDAEAAMTLIRDYHLVEAVSDDVPGLLMLRVSSDQLNTSNLTGLREATSEAISLLVDEAYNGIIQPDTVVSQLRAKAPRYDAFLHLYFASLWKGPERDEERIISKVERLNLERQVNEGRVIVEQFADLALSLFATYDRELLSLYLRTSTAYSLDRAVQICEEKKLVPDLVFLFSKTGETKRALFLIIDELDDASQAIAFTKENPDLWDDLLDYGMDKPSFIRALLLEVGTSIDAVKLIKRIPNGLEVPGLKDAVQKMVREWDVQYSISEGVARVLRGEVAASMEVLREGRRRAVKFEVKHARAEQLEVRINPVLNTVDEDMKNAAAVSDDNVKVEDYKPGRCIVCDGLFEEEETDFLVGFACGHVFHLDCLLDRVDASKEAYALVDTLRSQTRSGTEDGDFVPQGSAHMSVGSKISHAQVIRSAIGGGCPCCATPGDGSK